MEKEDYRIPGIGFSIVLFIVGVYLLGQAGAGLLESGPGNAANTGSLFSIGSMAMIQFIFGICLAIVAFFIFVVLSKKKADIESDL
jgi:hypothetical protein